MKAQQSTKFEASCGLWTRPLWYFGSVSRKTSCDRKMSKCKTARKRKKKKDVRNNKLLFLPEDDSVCNTVPKSFYTPGIHKVLSDGRATNGILLWSMHSELHLSILCLKSWLWPWNFISIALGMVLWCWEQKAHSFWSFYLHRAWTKKCEKGINLKSEIFIES